MNVIFLTTSQAESIRGETSPRHSLDPVPHGDGFILPTTVLSDPAHAELQAFLSKLPVAEYIPPEE